MVLKGFCCIVHLSHFEVCSPTVDGGTTARGSDDGDQLQRGSFPPGHHADGRARVTRPMVGFKAFEATQATRTGIERMHMIKKKQMVIEARDEGFTAAELFSSLAA